MKYIFKFGGELLWTTLWIFLVLVIGFGILSFLSNRFSGNLVGNAADWVEQRAQPQE